jgi:hypothetical protein
MLRSIKHSWTVPHRTTEEARGPSNKELKLTKPSQNGASQLNSVFGRQSRVRGEARRG